MKTISYRNQLILYKNEVMRRRVFVRYNRKNVLIDARVRIGGKWVTLQGRVGRLWTEKEQQTA